MKTLFKKVLIFFLLSGLLSSCSALLDIVSHYDDCSYPGCDRKIKKGSAYCPHHDGNLMKNNINTSLKNMRKQASVGHY